MIRRVTAAGCVLLALLLASPEAWAGGRPATPETLKWVLLSCAWICLAGVLLNLTWISDALRRALAPLSAAQRKWLWGLLAAGLLLRLIGPHRMQMVFFGYELVERAIRLDDLPRYGVGSAALYHLAFYLLPRDHLSVLYLNSVLGALTTPLLAAWVARITPEHGPRAALAFAAVHALAPPFIIDHGSESILVPALLFAAVALLCFDLWWTDRGGFLWPAVFGSLLAAMIRGDTLLIIPPLLLGLAWLRAGSFAVLLPELRSRWRALAVATGVALWLIAPHVYHLRWNTAVDVAMGNFQHMQLGFFLDLPKNLLLRNLVLRPLHYPVALTAIALLALLRLRANHRRPLLLLLPLALAWLSLYYLDFNETSVGRLHIPGGLLVAAAACVGAATAGWLEGRRAILVGGLVVLTALPGLGRLSFYSNSDVEDALLYEVAAALPGEAGVLVRIGYDDPGSFGVHRMYPDYLWAPPYQTRDIARFLERPDLSQPVYFYRGLRCYAHTRDHHSGLPPEGAGEQPACVDMRERFALEPVFERQVENRSEEFFTWYPPKTHFEVGLYRVARPKPPG